MSDVATLIREHTEAVTRQNRELLEQASAELKRAIQTIKELRADHADVEQRITKAHQVGFDLAVEMHKQGLLKGPGGRRRAS